MPTDCCTYVIIPDVYPWGCPGRRVRKTWMSLVQHRMSKMVLSCCTSFVAAMLFAVHPIHTEAVSSLVVWTPSKVLLQLLCDWWLVIINYLMIQCNVCVFYYGYVAPFFHLLRSRPFFSGLEVFPSVISLVACLCYSYRVAGLHHQLLRKILIVLHILCYKWAILIYFSLVTHIGATVM